VLARLIDTRPTFDPQEWLAELPAMDLFGSLLFQVAGQQLSVAATRRALGRIEMLFDGRLPSPAELLEVTPESLRQAVCRGEKSPPCATWPSTFRTAD
jgi:DNA-3-methyladenine glycosylase II